MLYSVEDSLDFDGNCTQYFVLEINRWTGITAASNLAGLFELQSSSLLKGIGEKKRAGNSQSLSRMVFFRVCFRN